eukprot:4357230-Amphidinium_carterae.1
MLPIGAFMSKNGLREDWYFWDHIEQYRRCWKSELEKGVAPEWRMRGYTSGFRNARDAIFKLSVNLCKEECRIWAKGHKILDGALWFTAEPGPAYSRGAHCANFGLFLRNNITIAGIPGLVVFLRL